MKILHTGDLHLDSAFGAVGAVSSDKLRQRQRECLIRIFDCACKEQCDMVLIAGDLFDTVYVTPETSRLCLGLFSDFAKPVVISPGNHDPYVPGGFYQNGGLPENVFVFSSPEFQMFDFPEYGVSVGGYAFMTSALSQNPLEGVALDGEGKTLILCAHGDLDMPTSRYAPILTSDIKRIGFAYAALGHVHNPRSTEKNIRYCGFPEGRGFDEQGEGGVLIVTVEDGRVREAERKIISSPYFVSVEISVDGCGTSSEVEAAVAEVVEKYRSNDAVSLRVELLGTVCEGVMPPISQLTEKFSDNFEGLEIRDMSLSLPNGDFLERDITLRGELYRTLRPMLLSDDSGERTMALRALRIGLAAIEGKSFTDGGTV